MSDDLFDALDGAQWVVGDYDLRLFYCWFGSNTFVVINGDGEQIDAFYSEHGTQRLTTQQADDIIRAYRARLDDEDGS